MRFFEEAAAHNYPGDIGPYTEATLPAVVGSRQNERLLETVIFDLDAGGLMNLSLDKPAEFAEEDCVIFGKFRRTVDWPASVPMVEAANNFVAQGGDRLEGYYSALEAPPLEVEEAVELSEAGEEPGVQGLLKQLLSQSEVTQRVVTGMRDRVASLETLEARLKTLENKGPLGATPKAAAAPQLFQADPNGLTPQKQAR